MTLRRTQPFGMSSENLIGGVTVSVLPSSVFDRGFKPLSGQIKDNKLGIFCFSTKHALLRSATKDLLAPKQLMCPNGAT